MKPIPEGNKGQLRERFAGYLMKIRELPRRKEELWDYYGSLREEDHTRLRRYFDDLAQFFARLDQEYPGTFTEELKLFSGAADKVEMIKKGLDKIPPKLHALSFSYYNTDLYLWYPKIKRFGILKLPLQEQHTRWEPVNAINMGIRDVRDYYRKLMEDNYDALVKLVEDCIKQLS